MSTHLSPTIHQNLPHMEYHIYPDPESLSEALANWICADIEKVLSERNRYAWVLTGGNSPKRLYELLSSAPYRDRIDWSKLHIFWGDERAVPFSDDRNNARMTFSELLNKVPVNPDQVHVMDTRLEPAEAASRYEELLRRFFEGRPAEFDLVLNGMGEDGHTLSLFPGTAAIHEQERWVLAYYLPAQSMYRITLTPPLVNQARKLAFLSFGAVKAKALKQVLQGAYQPDLYPSQVIRPATGELHWFVDEAASSLLDLG